MDVLLLLSLLTHRLLILYKNIHMNSQLRNYEVGCASTVKPVDP
jgi:hypothetical protein